MLATGISYMFVGMFVVFSFLILQVICMMVMSLIVRKYFPEEEAEESKRPVLTDKRQVVAAIVAGLKHRSA
jgi:sodium pump decarboxylase gamma subunit